MSIDLKRADMLGVTDTDNNESTEALYIISNEVDGVEYKNLVGANFNSNLYSLRELLEGNASILKKAHHIRLEVDAEDKVHLTVNDDEDTKTYVSMGLDALYTQLRVNRGYKVIEPQPLDSQKVLGVKKWCEGVIENCNNSYTPVNLTCNALTKMFDDYENLVLYAKDSKSLLLSGVLENPVVLKNTDEETQEKITALLTSSNGEVEVVRTVCVEDGQEVIFPLENGKLFPDYEDIKDIPMYSYAYGRMREFVPEFPKLVGPYINLSITNPVVKESIYGTNTYTDLTPLTKEDERPQLSKGAVAQLCNSVNFEQVLRSNDPQVRSLLDHCKITGRVKNGGVTIEYIKGSSGNDSKDIMETEKRYYNALLDFYKKTYKEDIENAPVMDWRATGLFQLKEYSNTFNKDYVYNEKSVNSDEMTLKELALKSGLTEEEWDAWVESEVPKLINSKIKSPNNIKWFSYAINLALVANRAYTGAIPVPYGYSVQEFVTDNSEYTCTYKDRLKAFEDDVLDGEEDQYDQDVAGMVFMSGIGGDTKSFNKKRVFDLVNLSETNDEGESIVQKSSEDLVFMPQDDLLTSKSIHYKRYWKGFPYNFFLNTDFIHQTFNISGQGDCDVRAKSPNRDMHRIVMDFLDDIKGAYVYPEALIKLLRFGANKPALLTISNYVKKSINLTTGVVYKAINKTNPLTVEFNGKSYTSFLSGFLLHNCYDFDFYQNWLKLDEGNKYNAMLVGIVVSNIYKQDDDKVEAVNTMYDIETLGRMSVDERADILGFNSSTGDFDIDAYNFIIKNKELPRVSPMYVQQACSMVEAYPYNWIKTVNTDMADKIINRDIEMADEKRRAILAEMNKKQYTFLDIFSSLSTLNFSNKSISIFSSLMRTGSLDKILSPSSELTIDSNTVGCLIVYQTVRTYLTAFKNSYTIQLNDGVVRPSSPKDYNLTVEDIQGTLDTWMNREEEKIVEESVGERVVRTLTELIKTKQGIDVDDYKGNIQMYKFYIDVNDKKYMRFVTFVFNPAVDNNKLYYILDIKGQEYKEVESAFKSKFKDDSYRVMELDLMPHLKAVKGTIDKGAYGTKEQTLGVYLTRVYIPLTSSAGERFKSLF